MTDPADLDAHYEAVVAAAPPVDHNIPWIAAQRWEQVLFVNWPVPVASVRPLVPAQLEIDTYEGQAWGSLLPLKMAHVHLRGVPPIPHLTDFPELNLRTYVTDNDHKGVWFFSLDAPSGLAVFLGREVFHLNYREAEMSMATTGDTVKFSSQRDGDSATFRSTCAGTGPAEPPTGSLEEFLCERYSMFALNWLGHLRRGDIRHSPWPLQKAEHTTDLGTVASSARLACPDQPAFVTFSAATDTVVWPMLPT